MQRSMATEEIILIPVIPSDGVKQDSMVIDGDEVKVGDFTGRCLKCGSNDLWDDMTAYGCNQCKWIRFTG